MNGLLARLGRPLKGKILVFAALFMLFGAVHTALKLSGGEDALQEARARLAQEEAERQRLEAIYDLLGSEDYIERQARDKLGLAREGETIVVLPPAEELRRFAPREEIFDAEFEREKLPIFRQWVRLFLPEVEKRLRS